MDALQCLKTRRSIRKFQNKRVEESIIQEIIDCARHAPSSHNTQPWEFIVVEDSSTIEKLSGTHQWAGFIKTAPIVIIPCINENLVEFKPNDIASVSVAVQNLMLAAHAKGLGTCWVYVKDNEDELVTQQVRKIIDLPGHIDPLCMVPLGYPDQTPGQKKLRPLEEIVHKEKY